VARHHSEIVSVASGTEPFGPRQDDVVVERRMGEAGAFVVRRPARRSRLEGTRDEAVRLARAFAANALVDLWYLDGSTRRLLEAYRPRAAR
jgi:hypothetical protein